MAGRDVALYVVSIIIIVIIMVILIYQLVAYGSLKSKFKDDKVLADCFYMILIPFLFILVLSIIYISLMGYKNYSKPSNLSTYYRVFAIIYLVTMIVTLLLSVAAWLTSLASKNHTKNNDDVFLSATTSTVAAILVYILVIIALSIFIYLTRNTEETKTDKPKDSLFSIVGGGNNNTAAAAASPAASNSPAAEANAPAAVANVPAAPAAVMAARPKAVLANPAKRNFQNLPKPDKKTQPVPDDGIEQNIAGNKVNYTNLSPKIVDAIVKSRAAT